MPILLFKFIIFLFISFLSYLNISFLQYFSVVTSLSEVPVLFSTFLNNLNLIFQIKFIFVIFKTSILLSKLILWLALLLYYQGLLLAIKPELIVFLL
jgi:hypothetical protein